MKLLLYIHSLVGAGAERVTVNLANAWAADRREVTIVTSAPVSDDAFELHPDIVRISFGMSGVGAGLIDGTWRTVQRIRALRRVLEQVRPDVAIGVMHVANVILAAASRGMPDVRTIGTEHIYPGLDPLDAVRSTMRRHAYGHLDKVVALTRESATWLEQNTHARDVAVIPNAVPWPLSRGAPILDPSRPAGRRRLVSVGRLAHQKGFDRLVDAFARVAGAHADWDLAILGEGADRESLERAVQRHGLVDRVAMPGWVGNVGDWYEQADLFVVSSRYEGFSCVLAEAMAYGLPAVSFDCEAGPRDIIRHGIDGLLVPADDVGALADALGSVMGSPDMRARFGARAVEARQRFAPPRIGEAWDRVFDALGRPAGSATRTMGAAP